MRSSSTHWMQRLDARQAMGVTMPILRNAKHERFAQELAGGNSAAKSYEMAGFTPNRHNASTLSRKQHILDRVTELLADRDRISKQSSAKAIEAAGLTKQWVLEALIENAMVALGRRTIRTKFVPRGESIVRINRTHQSWQTACVGSDNCDPLGHAARCPNAERIHSELRGERLVWHRRTKEHSHRNHPQAEQRN